MPRAAVIGAGIAGLSAAYRLFQEGIEVTVFEASDRPGGVIRSERVDGFLVEHGPNSIQTKTPELEALITELGLENRRITASDSAKRRYIVRGGKAIAAPMSPPGLFRSRLFSSRAKLRLLREPFIRSEDPSRHESVADFIRRRFGPEILDYGVNPFVAGVYAGDPQRLSVRHALPRLFELEQQYGSVIKGQLKNRRHAKGERMFSFDEGLEVLPVTLARVLGHRIITGARISQVGRESDQWVVRYPGGSEFFDAAVFCAPLHQLRTISLPWAAAQDIPASTTYPPLSVVALGYNRESVEHSLDGFGLLVPGVEPGFRILGTLFTSSIFPNRAPAGSVLLTSFVGGMRAPEEAEKSDDELFGLVHGDLRRLLGLSSEPTFHRRIFWKHSIPQYELGYESTLDAIDRLESSMPGWYMAGNYRTGVAVGDAAQSGVVAARRCAAFLKAK